MKIIYIIRSIAFGGGAETLVYEIYKKVQKRIGAENVMLVVFQESKIFGYDGFNKYEKELNNDPNFIFCNSFVKIRLKGKNIVDNNQLNEIITNFKPTIIHSHLYLAELYSRSVYFPDIKWFSHFHDNMIQFQNFTLKTLFRKNRITNYFEKKYLFKRYKLNGGNNFIAISNDTYEFAKKTCLNYKVTLLENGINLDNYQKIKEFKFDKIRIINIGSFVEKKNQLFFIEIAKELKARSLDFEIVLLGHGDLINKVKNEVDKNNLSFHFVFPGIVRDVNPYLRDSNIYVHTATYEPFGLVLIEAMNSGLPIVTLNGKGNKDLIINDYNGYMIEREDSKIFANMIQKVLENKNLHQKLSNNAIEFAQKYSLDNYIDKLFDIYQS